jgi:hypothetical protein
MRCKSAVLAAVLMAASVMPCVAVETTPPSSATPAFDPSVEQDIRRSCNVECFKALEQCLRESQASPSPCPTASITCFIGCRACVPTYRACRTGASPRTHEDCLRQESSCVAEKRKSQQGRTDLIRFSGGDGSSVESAVMIEGAHNEEEGIVAESYWISRNRPGWRKGDQALISANGRQFDRISYASPDGKQAVIFFDVTSFFGKM